MPRCLAISSHEFPLFLLDVVWIARSEIFLLSLVLIFIFIFDISEYYRQTPPKVPHFLKTLFRRKLVLWFLASEILRDYWLSGVSQIFLASFHT